MRRRHALSIGAGAVLAGWSALAARAQVRQPAKRVGLLALAAPDRLPAQWWDSFFDEMRRRGWQEGRNLVYVHPDISVHAMGPDAAARQLVSSRVDLIYCAHVVLASAALRATQTIPIVASVDAAVELGFAKTLSHPGGNVTGVMLQSYEEHGKVLSLLREIRPGLSRLGVSVGQEVREWNAWFDSFEAVARSFGIQVVALPEHYEPGSIAPMLAAGAREKVQVLVLVTGSAPWLNTNQEIWRQISAWAVEHQVITKGSIPQRGHAVLAFGFDIDEAVRLSAGQVDRVLRGANPAELPFMQPTRFDLVINQRLARAVGWPAPRSVLLQATEVIE